MNGVSMTPDQAAALNGLARETRAIALDVMESDHSSLWVSTYHELADTTGDEALEARWWSISVTGTIRAQSPRPREVVA